MARKKKVKQPKQEVVKSNSYNLSYQGKIKVQILHGNRVISTKTYTNNGLKPLFKYISHSLAGSHYSDLRPCKIMLYKCTQSEASGRYENPLDFNWAEATTNNYLTPASPYVVYDATPVVTEETDSYATTFRFKIPYYWLYLKSYNVIGLYTVAGEACAYYLFVEDDPSRGKIWDTKILNEEDTGNYSLVIEWTMEVSNK